MGAIGLVPGRPGPRGRAGGAVLAAARPSPAGDWRRLAQGGAQRGAAAPGRPGGGGTRRSSRQTVEPPELAGASKKTRLAWWYERDPDYRNRSRGRAAVGGKRLAPKVDLAEGTARAYLGQICADLEKAGETS